MPKLDPPFDAFVILDFEATCDDDNPPRPQEIIEFPSVLLSARTLEVVDTFERFVRPLHHRVLTKFCTELTGIEQAHVDAAQPFVEVLAHYLAWLRGHGFATETDGIGSTSFAIVTCGDWDLMKMLPEQARVCTPPLTRIPLPFRRWINVKRPFRAHAGFKAPGMPGMLRALGLELTGRHHRGIDDCRNIAKIVRSLIKSGQRLELTARLSAARHPPVQLVLRREGHKDQPLELKKRSIGTLLGVASGAFRTQARRVFAATGEALLTDDDLFDLDTGAVLRVD